MDFCVSVNIVLVLNGYIIRRIRTFGHLTCVLTKPDPIRITRFLL